MGRAQSSRVTSGGVVVWMLQGVCRMIVGHLLSMVSASDAGATPPTPKGDVMADVAVRSSTPAEDKRTPEGGAPTAPEQLRDRRDVRA